MGKFITWRLMIIDIKLHHLPNKKKRKKFVGECDRVVEYLVFCVCTLYVVRSTRWDFHVVQD